MQYQDVIIQVLNYKRGSDVGVGGTKCIISNISSPVIS